uniref:Uncharacterized protein n=1 Tax=Oryza punctata TaxID=4537 RepID=A0A0E0M8F3_ORYPU
MSELVAGGHVLRHPRPTLELVTDDRILRYPHHVGARPCCRHRGSRSREKDLAVLTWRDDGGAAYPPSLGSGDDNGGGSNIRGLTVTLAFTQLLYVLLLHAAVAGERCGLACPADA